MKTPVFGFIMAGALFSVLLCGSASATNVDVWISVREGQLSGFHLAVGDYYRVPKTQVIVVKKGRIPDDELPVVFFIAQRANVTVDTILRLRLSGMGWWDISLRYGLGPDVYYVPVKMARIGPPYGKAYGYYKNPKRKGKVVFTDHDVINLVNLRFISEYYAIAPEAVIEKRGRGEGFQFIFEGYEKEKGGKHKMKSKPKGKGRD